MIEVVYEKEKQKPMGNEGFFRIPNNIRQIGEAGETNKIYIEDYAYTYLSRIASEHISQGMAAILLGQVNWQDGISYLFIKSAVVIADMDVGEDHLVFSEEIWNQIYEKSKEYFAGQDIVGWFLSIPGCCMELHDVICKTHLNHFGGSDKVLLVMEPVEKEEGFYRYEGGQLKRQEGYYIYYEKNEPMQNYLIAQKGNQSMEKDMVEDRAVKNFRKIIEHKKEVQQTKRKNSFVYAAATGMLAIVIVAGVVRINDYSKMKELSEEAAAMEMAKEQEHQVKKNIETELPKKEAGGQAAADTGTGTSVTEQHPAKQRQVAQQAAEEAPAEASAAQEPPKEEVSAEEAPAEESQETGAAPEAQSYVVRRGDTITSISQQHYGTAAMITEICRYNNMTEEQIIYPGQIILLP